MKSAITILRLTLLLAVGLAMASCDMQTDNPKVPPAAAPNTKLKFVTIPAGEYVLSAEAQLRYGQPIIKIDSFRIRTHELTNAQFAEFVDATRYVTDAEKRGWSHTFEEGMGDFEWKQDTGACWKWPQGMDHRPATSNPDHPVTHISYNDALAYCEWSGTRLPTIYEWEIAAMAGATTRFPWGDDVYSKELPMANIWEGPSHRENFNLDGFNYMAPVGSFPANKFGLYDVVGNVFEYCNDPTKPDMAATRGGSWWCWEYGCVGYRVNSISYRDFSFGGMSFGVRVARSKSQK